MRIKLFNTRLGTNRLGALIACLCAVSLIAACGNSGTATDDASDAEVGVADPKVPDSDSESDEAEGKNDEAPNSDTDASDSPDVDDVTLDEPEEYADLRSAVPASIREAGVLTVGTTPTYQPYEYLDEDDTTVIGQNADVMEAIGEVLGLGIEYMHIAEFGAVLTGLAGDRYDTAIIFGDTLERQEIVDIVSFYYEGTVFMSKLGSSTDPTAPCGATVSTTIGNAADAKIDDINQTLCIDAGLESMDIVRLPNQDQQLVQLQSERSEFLTTSLGVAATLVEVEDDYQIIDGGPYYPMPIGIAVNKGSELGEIIADVLQVLSDEDRLRPIFERWNTESALEGAVIGINIATE